MQSERAFNRASSTECISNALQDKKDISIKFKFQSETRGLVLISRGNSNTHKFNLSPEQAVNLYNKN